MFFQFRLTRRSSTAIFGTWCQFEFQKKNLDEQIEECTKSWLFTSTFITAKTIKTMCILLSSRVLGSFPRTAINIQVNAKQYQAITYQSAKFKERTGSVLSCIVQGMSQKNRQTEQ
jgi:hypothetical protein